MPLRPINGERRNSNIRQEFQNAKAERQAIKALAAELQVIIDSITPATTLGELRGYTKDLTRTTRRLLRAVT